jgi:exodeoxyribonuclease V beta subunit
MTEHASAPPRDDPAELLDLGLRIPVQGVQLIEASAGTGKTFTVATLYARLVIALGLPVARVLAVTFTEAATRELRAQLRERLAEARTILEAAPPGEPFLPRATDAPTVALSRALLAQALAREPRPRLLARLRQAVEQMDLAPIHTIHAFCQRALHEHALEAGQPLDARELLLNDGPLRQEVALEFWRLHSREPGDAELLTALWGAPATLARSLRGLLALDQLLPEPGPGGSGGGDAGAALRDARAELAHAFDADGEAAREKLRAGAVHATYSKDAAVDAVWNALRDWRPDPLDTDPATDKLGNYTAAFLAAKTKKKHVVPVSPLFEAIGRWVAAREAADAARDARRLALVHAARDFAQARIAALKHERGLLGFDDMIRGVHLALEGPTGEAFATALRAQYAVALVDEFQDTDPRQWDIFRSLFARPAPGDGDTPRALFLIGDPKQAIYRFRGGDVATYLAAQSVADARHPLPRNFRSRPLALAAVETLFTRGGDDAFDQDGIAFEHVVAGGRCDDDALLLGGEPAPGLVLQVTDPGPDGEDGMDALRAGATAACVSRIHALLSAGQRGEATMTPRHGAPRPVGPGDITVLVARNVDAARIQRALSALGIPSVAAGRCSLYQTEEAQHLAWLLEALVAPADEGRLRAALATPLFGLDAAALSALDTDLAAHRDWQDQLEAWQARARRHGPTALLGDICATQAPRLLRWPDGERRLSNYLQLAEDLQSADAQALGLPGLLAELQRRIEDADPDNDAELLRLESDADRVRIMTVHVSKGLTLDLVFVPYAGLTGTEPQRERPPMAKVHAGLARVGMLFPSRNDPACSEDAQACRAEHVRLLYVALTRARLATWIGWGPGKRAGATALGWLLHRAGGAPPPAALDADAIHGPLADLVAAAPRGAIAVEFGDDADAVAALPRLRFGPAAPPPPGRVAARMLGRDWWVHSFSQLAREGSGADPRGADDELETLPLAGADAAPTHFAGTRFGNALHDALEHVDFAAWRDWPREGLPPPGQLEPLARALRGSGYGTDADQAEGVPLLAALVADTLNAPMPEGTRLAALAPSARVAEMEFHLALSPAGVDALLALLHAHDLVPARRGFGQRQRLEGLLTGRIDLIYEAGGRYYVLDYKSNLLADYGAATVDRAVREGEYDLQYLLYTVALHRWLRFRLGAAYAPEQHLGGVRYLFCRGLDRDDPALPGVHARTLPVALIEAVDALWREPARGDAPSTPEGVAA